MLAPIACMSTWLVKSSSWATFWTRRPLIGNALIPAAPTSGLTRPRVASASSLPKQMPAAVSSAKAPRPSSRMRRVWICRNVSACMRLPMVRPRKRVETLVRVSDAAPASCGTTPDSFRRLPSISVATSGADCGTSRPMATVTTIGKRMTAARGTGRGA